MPTSFSEVVVFGDSISDTGNVFLATGGAAVGEPYFEGRFSNGPVWVEVLAEELGLSAPAPSLGGGTNYAWGGAETGPGLSFFETPNVGMQVDAFLGDRGRFDGDELIVVAAGSNDLSWQAPFGPGHFVENLREHITDLANAGGKTFLVANSPVGGSSGAKFNELLAKELDRLDDRLTITILQFDMHAMIAAMTLMPGDFGLTSVTDPACPGCGIGIPEPDAADTLVPNPDEYLLWDQIHWTRVVHQILGSAAADLVQAGTTSLPVALSAAGADTPPLHPIDIRIAALDDNAASGSRLVDPTPGDDSEFTTTGDQGKPQRMDVFSVLRQEVDDSTGTLPPFGVTGTGLWHALSAEGHSLDPFALDALFAALADEPKS